jgi:hypothetical protein
MVKRSVLKPARRPASAQKNPYPGVLSNGTQAGRRLLADIEHRSADSDAVPLVKVLTRRECRRLFARFRETRIRVDQIDYAHFWPSLAPATGRSRRLLEALAHRWGWYLTVFAWE